MKKGMYSLLMLLVLSGAPLWAYTVSGRVYYKGTAIPVPGASLRLTESGGASNTGIADEFGSFSMGWKDSNLVDRGMVLTAGCGMYWGRESWTATQNTETQNIDVSICIEPSPSICLDALVLRPGDPGTFVNPVVIQAPNATLPVRVQNGQVNMVFNPAANVVNVASAAPDVFITSWMSPGAGLLEVNVEVFPPRPVNPLHPAESFFDVFFEIELPESGAELYAITIDSAEFQVIKDPDPIPVLVDIPVSTTDNVLGEPEQCKPHFLVDAQQDWTALLKLEWPQPNICPMTPAEWNNPEWGYKSQWSDYLQDGDLYPSTEFLPADLYVYEGGGGGGVDPEDAGLVMTWGDEGTPTGDYASAWKYDYGLDPDLTNAVITITVTAPQMGPSGQINAVSFGIQDVNGNIRSWWWSCPAPIPWNVPTTVTIDTSQIGLGATNPPATGFMSNPAFNLAQSQFFIVDENFQWVFGQQPVPSPGQQQFVGMWNYWHNLTVTKKTNSYKGTYVKWSQSPELHPDSAEVPKINGWDEMSVYRPAMQPRQIMADDWLCQDERPITDLHWWGSFVGWTQPHLPLVLPRAFHMGIWTDVPAGADRPFSHPGELIWEHTCDNWVWNFAGYDIDPRLEPIENEACFQFNQLLSQDDWFYQAPAGPEGRVYWLSIAAIYDSDVQEIRYPWGWKTRPHFFNDDAVRIRVVTDATGLSVWPPKLGSIWLDGTPVEYPEAVSWDLAFELTTNLPAYADNPIPGDIGGPGGSLVPDGKVNLNDLTIMATHWLMSAP